MKNTVLLLALSIPVFLPACQKGEIAQAPAAEVSNPGVTAAPPAAAPAGEVARAKVIAEKSSIGFVGAKVTREHTGRFRTFDGSIEYAGAAPQRISFDVDLNSIETDAEKLTAHLKSPDFFDVAKHPRATFTSTSITEGAPAGSPAGTTHAVRGTLAMHGVSREVSFPVAARQTPEGVRAQSEFRINRHDWGISYAGMADDLIKDEVLIRLDMLFPPPPAA